MMDISSMLEVQVDEVKEMDIKENVTPRELHPSTTNVPVPISQEEYSFYKLMFGHDVSAVRFKKLHCTACDVHIGSAPAESYNMFEHPILHTLLCAKCRDFYGDGTFEQGDDATDMFCRWCANGGNLYCCSFCSNTFCYKCIKRNFDPILRKKIEADEKWKCFVCDPRDLYTARATCWALLQHIQSMHRLLQNNRNLTQKEIEEKMNLDETKCCPRKRKRKRRRTTSNSEEEDETYSPTLVEAAVITKRRRRGRGRGRILNGMSDKPHKSEDSFVHHSEILPSLLSCEQTMVEGESATVNMSSPVISQHHTTSLLHKVKSTVVQHPTMYNAAIMNVVTAPNFLHPTSPVVPLSHVTGSINQINQMNLYQAMPYTPVPMVTIPNQSVNILNRSHFPLPEVRTSLLKQKPNVIEIESDSEDIAVVGSSQSSSSFRNHVDSNKAVPVALVSSKNNYENSKKQDKPDKCKEKTLNQRLFPHGREVDKVLMSLKTELQDLFKVSKQEELRKYELNDARITIKQFHSKIRDAVTQLAYINDRIVREFNRWKMCNFKAGTVQPSRKNNRRNENRHEDIPLDMVCVDESDTESENDTETQCDIINPSEFVGTTNVVEEMQFFKKKDTTDRAVGDDSILLADKSIQIYDVELQDYDRCIRHSALKKINKKTNIQNNASTSSTAGKKSKSYEEYFIQFLRKESTEEQNMQDPKNLPDPNETPLKDLIEANSPFISEMLETMDKSVVPNTSNSDTPIMENNDSKSSAVPPMNSITCKAVDDLVKMVSSMNDNLDEKKTITNASAGIDESEKHSSRSDETCAVNVTKGNEQNSSRTNCNAAEIESSNEDDCTIIED